MHIESLEGLTRVLQASISPVALVSGVGLLILSQTNRFSRVTDRLRELSREAQESPGQHPELGRQIVIFNQRARLLRMAIGSALLCALLASVMVLVVFAIAVLDFQAYLLVLLLFALSLLALISSLILFLRDTHLAMRAVEHVLLDYENHQGHGSRRAT
ncbi:MAG: hypothetical protein JWR69_4016 [Pedosphaera sp.]|nr:hypothetical protein [Pedosphaera sp.]